MEHLKRMPVIFIGHGSPMNAIEDNEFTKNWAKIAKEIPTPKAILVISAHWFTEGTRVTDAHQPKVIYDMYGFPEELYQVNYRPMGSYELAHRTKDLISAEVTIDNSWGYDHGGWSVLCRMYPKADIPVYQLSVDQKASAEEHYRIGQEIGSLREEGVLILASGNVVHNLYKINWEMKGGYPWAKEFDQYIKDKVKRREFQEVVHYEKVGESAELAFYTTEHFDPLLYILGAARDEDKLTIFNDSCLMGSLSMTCFLFTE